MATNHHCWQLPSDVYITLGLSIMSALLASSLVPSKRSCHRLAALKSPCCQRRLSGFRQCLIPIALPRESLLPKVISLANSIAAVSHWLAPEGAKPMECNRHRPSVAKNIKPLTLGSWPEVSRRLSARRFTAAAEFAACPLRGATFAGFQTLPYRAAAASTHRSRGRCAIKPRSAPELKR